MGDLLMFKKNSFIRKRTILSIITTIIFLVLSNKYWLIIRHLPDRTSVKFDVMMFVILLVLIYLLVYKLTDYLANFKTIEGKSRIDIIFLTIFFVFLCIPMSNISTEKYSRAERRSYAEWKPLIAQKGVINYNFGNDFNSYFSDRFFLRKPMISLYKKLKILVSDKIIYENDIYYNKKTGWAFKRFWFEQEDITPKLPEIIASIQKLYNFCRKNNVKLFIVIVPVKEEVYPDIIEPFTLRQNNGKILEKEINEKIGNIAYFPLDILREKSKTDYTYPKTDPHWGELGGYIAANDFLKHFGYKQLKESDFEITEQVAPVITDIPDWMTEKSIGYYYEVLGLKNKQKYKHFTNKYEDEFTLLDKDDKLYSKDSRFIKAPNPQKVYLIGSSYSENMYRFLKFAFRDVIKRRINNNICDGAEIPFSRWQSEIEKTKPDMLIMIIESASQNKYLTLWDE